MNTENFSSYKMATKIHWEKLSDYLISALCSGIGM